MNGYRQPHVHTFYLQNINIISIIFSDITCMKIYQFCIGQRNLYVLSVLLSEFTHKGLFCT